MKMKAAVLIFILAATVASAQTTNLTSLLQQGLLEEQANRNLDAAIANYQTLAAQFDKDRQLAATAVFRIGECYRMQGKTNEAAAQYQRLLHDFADQTTLATLSRQNLTGMGFAQTDNGKTAQPNSESSTEMRSLATQIAGIEKLKTDPTECARAVQAIFPDDSLKKMLENLPKLQAQEVDVKANSKTLVEWATFHHVAVPAERFPIDNTMQPTNVMEAATAEVQKQIVLINQRVDFILGIQKARLKVLQSAAGATVAEANQSDNASVTTDEEDQEIRRIQQMIQNSPDLINAAGSEFTTPLQRAATAGWLKVATYLLDHGAEVNFSGRSPTALNNAAAAGNRAMVELLLSRGADINSKSGQRLGNTPLHTAADKNFQAVVEVLLANKAEVNARNTFGGTPLFYAAQGGHSKIVSLLLEHKADVNVQTESGGVPLSDAVAEYHPDVVKLLLAAGANPNVANKNGQTPLSIAAERAPPDLVALLLAAGANPNVNDNQNRTPLSYAAGRNFPEMVKMLLAAKADPNDFPINAPLLMAINAKSTNSTELLLQAGANPNAKTKVDPNIPRNGDNYADPLWLAVSEKQLPMVQLLLKYKADPNDTKINGRSLLFSALGDTNILEALLDAGAKVDALDETASFVALMKNYNAVVLKQTSLAMAVGQNNVAAVEILLKHGANPNISDTRGNTVLHWAVTGLADREIFRLLLDAKANPNVRNSDDKTPLDYLKQVAEGTILPGVPPPSLQSISLAGSLADFLRQHGALDKLPDWDHITISRPAAKLSKTVFYKGSNDWSQVSLYDLIGVQYDLLTDATAGRTRVVSYPYNNFANATDLPFPDFSSVVIHHPSTDGLKWETRKIDLTSALNSGNCDDNVLLQFGDVVEIPEANHVLNQQWNGLTTNELATLKTCLMRHLKITVNGETTNFIVSPQIITAPLGANIATDESLVTAGMTQLIKYKPFMIWPVLNETKMLLSSSDLAQVKVKRTDAATGKSREWIVDCSDSKSPPNFWLRDGDVIEVPEKR